MLCSLFYNFLDDNLLVFKSFLNACTEGDNESLTLIFRRIKKINLVVFRLK